MQRWLGKLAVVTGASSGIGAAITEELVTRGMRVVGLARRIERLEKQADRLHQYQSGFLYGIQVDMSKTEEIVKAFARIDEEHGPIHALVNCAGIFANTTLIDGNVEKWKETFDINVLGLCTATKEVVANMLKHEVNHGQIIHMNSNCGHRPIDYVGENVYPASKYAVTALSNSWRNELVKKGTKIKVTSISPGYVKGTEMFEAAGSDLATMDFGDTITVKDISEAVVYVLSTPTHMEISELTVRTAGSEV